VPLVPTSKYSSYMQPLNQGIIYCMKWEYHRHLFHFLLWEIDRDIPTQDTRKLNILDAMCGAVAWESITPAVLQNHFANVASAVQVQWILTVMKKAANEWNCKATIVLEFWKNFRILTNLSQWRLISRHIGQLWPKLEARGRRGRGEHGEKPGPSPPDPSQRCSNVTVSAGFSTEFVRSRRQNFEVYGQSAKFCAKSV